MAEHAAVAPAATDGDDESATDGGSVVFVRTIIEMKLVGFRLYFVSHTFLHMTCSCLYTCSMYFIFEGSQVLWNPFFGLPGITPLSLTDSMIGSVP